MNIQLFCVPYAGSSATNYLKWKPYIKDNIDIAPLELSGRGYKINKPFYMSMDQALQDILEDFEKQYKGSRYMLFGHSLGCWLVYEMYYAIKNKNIRLPEAMFLSGRYPPFVDKKEKNVSAMSDTEFINMVKDLGGTSQRIFENSEFCNLHMNILKQDFIMMENFVPRVYKDPIESNVIVLTGTEDRTITTGDLLGWKKLVQSRFSICKIKGDHFFLFNNCEDTVKVINDML